MAYTDHGTDRVQAIHHIRQLSTHNIPASYRFVHYNKMSVSQGHDQDPPEGQSHVTLRHDDDGACPASSELAQP